MRAHINFKKLALALASVFVCDLSSKAAIDFRTIALSGSQAPGAPIGQTFDISVGQYLGDSAETGTIAALNESGGVAICTFLQGAGLPADSWGLWNSWGLWKDLGSGLQLVAETGMQEPGKTAGVTFAPQYGARLSFWQFNENGQVVFSRDGGIWSDRSGNLQLLVGAGDPAPGTPSGVTFHNIGFASENSSGRIAFSGDIEGPGVDTSFSGNSVGNWVERSDGTLSLIARQNFSILGSSMARVLSQPRGINDNGDVTFVAMRFSDTGASIWRSNNGGVPVPVAIHGQTAPGLGAGVLFDFGPGDLSDVTLNNAGHVSFHGRINGGGINHEDSLWSDREGGSPKLVLRSGVTAPDLSNLDIAYLRSVEFNQSSRYAVNMELKGPGVNSNNDYGMWVETSLNNFQLVARLGDQAPGTPAGAYFSRVPRTYPTGDTVYLGGIGSPLLNERGDIVFLGTLAGSGVDLANDTGIWAMKSHELSRLIVRTGDLFPVGDGDVRTIKALTLQDFNSAGQIVFSASFTDGTGGVFITSLTAVPEPSALAMFFVVVAAYVRAISGRTVRSRLVTVRA